MDAIEKIYEREGGPQAFYSGVVQETLKGVADSFLFFLAYSYVRQKRLDARGSGRTLPALEEIGVGVVAGAFSKLFTTPIQQIVTRKQTAAMMNQGLSSLPPPQLSTKDIASEIMREKGVQGFWSGYSASLILTLNPSITMLLHKALLQLTVPRSSREDPGGRMTFLLAAISKTLASTVTYPFSLAKTRAQVSSQKPWSGVGATSDREKSNEAMEARAIQARQRTVFSTILRIAQDEGIWALYQGLGPEVLKGFFSHGITMLMKDRIHAVIISLYYTLQKALKTYPSPGEVAQSASDRVQHAYEQGKGQASDGYAKGTEVIGNAAESAKHAVEKGKEQAGEMYEKSRDAVSDAASSAYSQGKDMVEKGQEAASKAARQAGDAANDASQQAREAVVDAEVKDGSIKK